MGVIVSVLQWVWNALSKVASLVVTIPGMIVAGITGGYAFVSELFGRIPVLYQAFHQLVGSLSRLLSTVNTSANGLGVGQTSISDTLCYFVALDSATSWFLLVLVSTVGLVGFLLIGFIASLLAIVAAMYTIRGTLKAVRIISGGMLSPAIAAIVGFVALSANAALDVHWFGDNQIVVTGIGGGGTGGDGVTIVYTNVVGMCTNCVAATPDEVRLFKFNLRDDVDLASAALYHAKSSIERVIDSLTSKVSNYSSFEKVPLGVISGSLIVASRYEEWYTNYVLTVDNTQTYLDKTFSNSITGNNLSNKRFRVASYNDGIFDFSQFVLDEFYPDIEFLQSSTNDLARSEVRLNSLLNVVNDLTEDPCTNIDWVAGWPSGDGSSSGSGGSSSSSCCCTNLLGVGIEQLDAIRRYVLAISNEVSQIERDVHATTNSVLAIERNFKQYAESMKNVLLNNASVVTVADSENSWSNVYRSGQSQLYSYNQSNILQRIELLLYGISGLEQATTNAMPESVDTSASEDITDSISSSSTSLEHDIQSQLTANDTLAADFLGLANNFSLFGRAGGVSYEVLPTMYVDYGGEQMQLQSLQIDSDNFQGFQKVATCVRYCFQAFYLALAVFVFYMFWKWVLGRVAKISLWLFDFINGLFG